MDDETLLQLFRKRLDATSEHAGQNHMTCACGRYHFAGKLDQIDIQDPEAWKNRPESPEEKELAELQAKAKADSRNYVEHEGERTIVAVRVNGIDYVEECPCGWDMRMARFFLAEQELIVRFLADVIEEQNKVNSVQSAIERVIAEKNFKPPILTTDQIPKQYKGPR